MAKTSDRWDPQIRTQALAAASRNPKRGGPRVVLKEAELYLDWLLGDTASVHEKLNDSDQGG